ncbi:response regulator [Pigmentiphaga sp.]|uniref:hybrid sensor histidine kinase/response regulator n=1 Tax=Pigmentiphaga sp. TaxID=1977564 RepID=UPI0025D2E13F|nr:response regulator [Pigmentiphaga sp.]
MNPPAMRVLLAEDDPHDAELTLERLSISGLSVESLIVNNEADFTRALDSGNFDLVLSDFHMPGFSGSQALRIARRHPTALPFIFVSGVLGEEHAVDMLKEGATDYVLKQRLERLPIVVRRALDEARERRSRHDAERRLRESETYFGQLIDALRDYSVATLSLEGRIESWNRASEWLFGYPAEEVIGRPGDMFNLPPEPGLPEPGPLCQQLADIGTGNSLVEERWLMRKNGATFYASIVTTAIFGNGGAVRGFSRIVRDMTDSRVAADLLQMAKEQAEAANRAKDRFLAVLSHELRTPLGPIYAAAQALDLRQDLPPGSRRSVELIKRNVEVEARLIDDLLDISKIVNDKLSLRLEPTDLVGILNGIAEIFREEAAARHIELHYTPLPYPVIVQADPARLQQIVWNLLKNAIKFTPRGGEIRITMYQPAPGRIAVDVSDTGIGIPPQALKRIFDAFDQGEEDAAQSRGGLGLGLAIASSLAQRHGGTLSVRSDGQGKGTTFTLTLDDPAGGTLHAPAEETLPASAPLVRPASILLVEDNVDTAEAMQYLLAEYGYEVEVAESVAAACRCVDARRYDVLVSDMGLPDGDGIDVLRRYAPQSGQIAVALTGYGMESDVRRCLDAGFAFHLTKPLDIDQLIRVLRREPRG